jgi:hypothetical protein
MNTSNAVRTTVSNGFVAGLRSRQLLLLIQALVIASISSVVPKASAQGYTVAAVVSQGTVRPDGAGTFSPVNPSLDGDFIVFNQGDACLGCASPDSLWVANPTTGELRKLVSTSTGIPGGVGTFGSFGAGPIARAGVVVFIGSDAMNRPGLYAVPTAGGAVVRLADTSTGVPGASKPFTTFAWKGFQHDGTTAVFTGGAPGVTGVYSVRLDGSGLARIADSDTPVNSQACNLFPVMVFSKPSISSGNIGFLGQTTFDYSVGFSGLYTQPLSPAATPGCAGPSPSAVSSLQTLPINPGALVQTALDYGRMDGATLVFRAAVAGTGTGGIFSTGLAMSSAGGALITVVDSRTALPGFGAVSFIGNFGFAADAGNTIFQAHDSTGLKSALFLASSGVMTRIAGTGDAVGGSAIAAVDAPEAGSLHGAAVAFMGTRIDGSRAIYVARPIPVSLGDFTGTVTIDGLLATGATVAASSGGVIRGTAVTNGSGLYSLFLPAGIYDLSVAAAGAAGSSSPGHTLGAGATIIVNLTLSRVGTIAGVVQNPSGTRLAGARVDVTGTGFSVGATTDSTGNFSIGGVPAGIYTVAGSAIGYNNLNLPGINVSPNVTTSVTLQLTAVSSPLAAFVRTDTTTQGSWKTVYGADGQAITNDVTNYPLYATVAFTGQSASTWTATTTDVRALLKGATTGRIASAWSSFTSFSIDINLTDGLPHQVALYCLDWDTANTRAERIDVLDPATGLVLASSPASAFTSGQYLVWNLSGHVTLRVTKTGASNAVVSGLFFDRPLAAPPALATVTPATGVSGTTVPVTLTGSSLTGASLNLGAGITATGIVATAGQITANLAIAATAPIGPQTLSVSTLGGTSSTVTFTVNPPTPILATITPALAVTGTSVPVTLTGTHLTSATLNLGAGVTAAGVVVTATQITATFNIAATAPVGLQNITVTTPGGTSSAVTFTINQPRPVLTSIAPAAAVIGTRQALILTGTNLNGATLSLGSGLTATGVVVTATQISATFVVAATAPLGAASIIVTTPGGTSNAITFTIVPRPAALAAFVKTDTTTQGTWKTIYGTDGQAIANDVTNYPLYAQVAFNGQAPSTWTPSTVDIRALLKGATTGRIASAWYNFSSYSIDINLTDGLPHQVALYCLDWDGANTRAERVDVLDAATGLVLASNSVSAFSSGQYQVWNLSGHITLRVTKTGAWNAVVSGLFFDSPLAPTPALATVTPATGVIGTTVPVTLTGTNLTGASLNLGPGITATGLVATAGQITANLAIAATAPVGPQTISVSTPGGTSGTVTFLVKPLAPTLATIAPALAVVGTNVPVTFAGTNLTGATLSLGAGITATGTVVTATQITATFNIAATAPVGLQNITVTTPGGTSSAVTFTINQPRPVLTSIAPAAGVTGISQAVILTGTNLAGASLKLGTGLTATGVVVTATQITATLAVAATASLGPANITVITPGGTSNAITFTVVPRPAALAAFVKTDATTQGTWKSVYGADGQAIANDVTNYPPYAQVAFTGQSTSTWTATTTDVRAPLKGAATGRIASAWSSFTSFSIDINLTDGLPHQVALYCLDWDTANTRAERVDVLDPATGLVLASSPVSAYSAGQYVVWNLSGHVTLRVTRTGASNAVVSGLFFN